MSPIAAALLPVVALSGLGWFVGRRGWIGPRALKIERIFCSGVSTQAVVQAAVRDGHDRDFEMVVIEDGCAAHSAEEHKNSMASIARFCRIETSATVSFG